SGRKSTYRPVQIPEASSEFWPYGMTRTGGVESFRAQAEAHFTHFIDFGAGETKKRPINTLGALFGTYVKGIGTTLLLTKKS
ncbi:MAG: hypothetical protein V4441_08930, partial [Pseudomonadota bacterium]